MRFSNMCDYKGVGHFIVKTGRVNIRILKPGEPYDKSFVVPIKKTSNRRPTDVIEPGDDDETPEDLSELTDASELTDPNEGAEQELPEDEFQPQ